MKHFLIILICLPLFTKAQDTIKITTPEAKQIVKDLVSGDSAKAELKLSTENITLLEKKVILKDSIISGYVQKDIMYEERIKNEQLKFDTQQKWIEQLRKDNKKLKVKLRFIQITGTAIIGGLTYLYITK
jgi:hypothetical protein